jgi:hypothetical protein
MRIQKRFRSGLALLLFGLSLAGCAASATAAGMPPSQAAWCGAPIVAFEDDGVAPAATLASWTQAAPLLGFTPLLPSHIPTGACLASAGGEVRNPIFGSRFTVIYALPRDGALTIIETPKQQDILDPQCDTTTGAAAPTATCQQTQGSLNITISSSLSVTTVRALLATLSQNMAWLPAH